eukprot:155975-Pelagomonas_calceolata.AAC.1
MRLEQLGPGVNTPTLKSSTLVLLRLINSTPFLGKIIVPFASSSICSHILLHFHAKQTRPAIA